MFNMCVLSIIILLGTLVGVVAGDPCWNVLRDEAPYAIGVLSLDVAKLLTNRAQDVRQPIQLKFRPLAPPAAGLVEQPRLDQRPPPAGRQRSSGVGGLSGAESVGQAARTTKTSKASPDAGGVN